MRRFPPIPSIRSHNNTTSTSNWGKSTDSLLVPFSVLLLFCCWNIMAAAAAAIPRTALLRSVSSAIVTELTLKCTDGMILAGQLWKSSSSAAESLAQQQQTPNDHDPPKRILCLHGWMDNCRSFHYLAPSIVNSIPNVELLALDFPGHGMSSHKSLDGPSLLLSELAYYVAEAVQQMEWTSCSPPNPADNERKNQAEQATSSSTRMPSTFSVIGHSMGAAVGCVFSSAFPEYVDRLVLIEGAGPLARNPTDISKHVREHVRKRLEGNANPREPRIYPSLEKAVQTRCFTAKNFPGNQWLSTEAATEMVLRGSVPVGDRGELKFRHDPRLLWPSIQYFSPEQTDSLYDNIECPTALILAEDGWPFDEERAQAALQRLRPALHRVLPGSHHFHADPESAEQVSQEVISFLLQKHSL